MSAVIVAAMLTASPVATDMPAWPTSARADVEVGVRVQSLEGLTIDSLRKRRFGSSLAIQTDLMKSPAAKAYAEKFFGKDQPAYASVIASYRSEGLRLYTRIDVPNTPAPARGYPVIVFLHGWVGYDAAEEFHFSYTPASMYAEMIDAYAKAGFLVFTPGYRGHGTINGVVADGRASMAAWDNATHISPVFYALDALNLIDGLKSIERFNWRQWGHAARDVRLDLRRLSIAGHSQGGDVALIVLATSGRGSLVANRPQAASIMSGTFADRFTQEETYRPMKETPQAFLSGDGTWTGSAVGKDGQINPHFVFAWPNDSVKNSDPETWASSDPKHARQSVREAVEFGYSEMYKHLNEQVYDLRDARFSIALSDSAAGYYVNHDPRVRSIMKRLGAFQRDRLVTARLYLHFSDRDHFSPASWNRDLCNRIVRSGGKCTAYEYPGNSHSMRLGVGPWFSPDGSREAYGLIVERDLANFR
jgi:dienelactone hydrolase